MAMNEEYARIRSYLTSQGARWSAQEIAEKIEIAYGEFAQAVSRSLSSAQLSFKPTPEDWSIVEVMTHITNANTGTCTTMLALAAGKEVKRGDSRPVVTADDDMAAIVAANKDFVFRSIREFPENPELESTAPHSMFGPLNCKEWLLFIRIHTLDHANQIKANRAHPNFPK